MKRLSISEVARQIGVRPSTIRYYEQIGILLPPERAGGQRRYEASILKRLAVIQHARLVGFSLEEIRRLFFGFRDNTPPSERWQKMNSHKLDELNALARDIRAMQKLLLKMQNCRCSALDECGEKFLQHGCADSKSRPAPWKLRQRAGIGQR